MNDLEVMTITMKSIKIVCEEINCMLTAGKYDDDALTNNKKVLDLIKVIVGLIPKLSEMEESVKTRLLRDETIAESDLGILEDFLKRTN